MIAVLVFGVVWLALAVALALVVGRVIRFEDERSPDAPPDAPGR